MLFSIGTIRISCLFEGLGIRLKEEDNGRMFPVTDKASSVVNALIGKVKELGTDIRTNSPVKRVLYENGRTAGIELKSGEVIKSSCVIIATGGQSVPQTGSTGTGILGLRRQDIRSRSCIQPKCLSSPPSLLLPLKSARFVTAGCGALRLESERKK